jgi:serine/threonine protein kinase
VIQTLGKYPGFAKFHALEKKASMQYLVMQLLGKSLKEIVEKQGNLSIACMAKVAISFISFLEIMHTNHFIHRDIKPENMMAGLGKEEDQVYLIDFGLSRIYRDKTTLLHLRNSVNQ